MMKRLGILLVILFMLLPLVAAEGGFPDPVVASLRLTPRTTADFEIGFSSVEITSHDTIPQPLVDGIVLNNSVFNEETGNVEVTNNSDTTWFYWKMLSPYSVKVTLAADDTNMYYTDPDGVRHSVSMNVAVLDDNGTEIDRGSTTTGENVFFSEPIEKGLKADSYRISISAMAPLNMIYAGLYQGHIKVTIGSL